DVAEIAVEFRRPVYVAAVEGEAVHAACLPSRDMPRRIRLGDVEDLEAALEVRILAADRKDLAIDQHDAVADTDLVRERAVRDLDLGELAGLRRIAHVDDGRSIRRFHVADVGDAFVDHDLPSPWTIEIADDLQTLGDRHPALQYKNKSLRYKKLNRHLLGQQS